MKLQIRNNTFVGASYLEGEGSKLWYITSLDEENYVCVKDGQSKYYISSNIQSALSFENKEAADRYIKNCMPKVVRNAYKPVMFKERADAERKPAKVLERSCLQDAETLARIRKFVSIINNHKKHYNSILESLSIVENKLTDMYHYIAKKDLNVVDGYKTYKQLQSLLRERRRLKDEKLLCEGLLDDIDKGDFSLEQFFRNKDRLDNAKYTPRALPGLFQNNDDN